MSQDIQRLPQVSARTGYSRSSIYQKIKQGLFPPCISLGTRAVGWPSSEIDALNTAKIAGKSDDEIRAIVRKLVAARKADGEGARS